VNEEALAHWGLSRQKQISRRIGWNVWRRRVAGKPDGKRPLKDLDVGETKTLKSILKC
jgi:hypothetical protein